MGGYNDNQMILVGKRIGYLFSYFLFTIILFLVLTYLNKMPLGWSYLHIMGITLLITIIGIITKRSLS